MDYVDISLFDVEPWLFTFLKKRNATSGLGLQVGPLMLAPSGSSLSQEQSVDLYLGDSDVTDIVMLVT